MQHDNHAPFTHGMEIEQFREAVPTMARSYTMSNNHGETRGWHRDGSGPRETSIGPAKNVKAILDTFYADTRDEDITWDWHAEYQGRGAGSHLHLCMADDVFADEISGWTISYNTCVELVPFLAPFFCHDWENGFRDSVDRWAPATLQRLSQSSVEDYVGSPSYGWSRSYNAVTFNPSHGSKPVTVELRLNEGHPAIALDGLLLLRRVCGRAVEAGWSPKLVDHRETLAAVYTKVYDRAHDVGLMTAMKEEIDGGIRFQEGRGIPGVDQLEFDTPFEVLKAIQRAYPQKPGTWRARVEYLVGAGRDDYAPANNTDALWHIDAPVGEFEWQNGPDMNGRALDADDEIEDLRMVGAGRAENIRDAGFESLADIQAASVDEIAEVSGIGRALAPKIKAQVAGIEFDRDEARDEARAEAPPMRADGGSDSSTNGSIEVSVEIDDVPCDICESLPRRCIRHRAYDDG